MGVNIKGVGTDIIRIEGVEKLHGCRHTIIPDRIEAGTYMIADSAMGKEVISDNTLPEHLESLIAKLREMGDRVEQHNEQVLIAQKQSFKAVDIKTLVYPGFPTELQQPFPALLTQATCASVDTETIYTTRLKHIDELRRMNADIKVE